MRINLGEKQSGLTWAAFRAALFILVIAAMTRSNSLFAQDNSLAFHRAEHLRRGINLSHWFAQVFDPKGYT